MEANQSESGLVVVTEKLLVPQTEQVRPKEEVILGKLDRAQRRRIARAAKKDATYGNPGMNRGTRRGFEASAKKAKPTKSTEHKGRVTSGG